MDKIEKELEKNGIKIVGKISQEYVNMISSYVSNSLVSTFAFLGLNYNDIFSSISKLDMYIASMPENSVGACYYYKSQAIYFRNTLNFDKIERLAIHECIHHLQEVLSSSGNLLRLGLCNYTLFTSFGNALNEASTQYMASLCLKYNPETVKYYDIEFQTISPDYYPLLCNLVSQLSFITGNSSIFESTLKSNDLFFDDLKNTIGEKNSFIVQQNFDKILNYENSITDLTIKLQTSELDNFRKNSIDDKIKYLKNNLKKVFFDTQNTIFTSYFDKKIKEITDLNSLNLFKNTLYSYSSLIGKSENYSFFNDYYIKKMNELSEIYNSLTGKQNYNLNMIVYKEKTGFEKFLDSLRSLLKISSYNTNSATLDSAKIKDFYRR